MEKLERIFCTLAFVCLAITGTGAELEKRAIIYEEDRRVEQAIFYGGGGITATGTILASWAYDRNNRKKKKSNTDYINQ